MKAIIAVCAFVLFSAAVAQEQTIKLTVSVENAQVSPGGYVGIRLLGPETTYHTAGSVSFSINEPTISDGFSSNTISWTRYDPLNDARYVKLHIKDDISISLPITVTLNASTAHGYSVNNTTFQVVEGTVPSDQYAGKYVATITSVPGNAQWYEFFCISSKTGTCDINIKNGVKDKYNGRSAKTPKYDCGDAGWLDGSKVSIREVVVFDASKLADTDNARTTAPEGHQLVDVAVCDFSSSSPFIVGHVNPSHVAKLR